MVSSHSKLFYFRYPHFSLQMYITYKCYAALGIVRASLRYMRDPTRKDTFLIAPVTSLSIFSSICLVYVKIYSVFNNNTYYVEIYRNCILLTKTSAQNEVALSYHKVRGLYFLAVVFAAVMVLVCCNCYKTTCHNVLLCVTYCDDSIYTAPQCTKLFYLFRFMIITKSCIISCFYRIQKM